MGAARWNLGLRFLLELAALAGFGVAFLPNPDAPHSNAAKASTVDNRQRIQESAAALQKKLDRKSVV